MGHGVQSAAPSKIRQPRRLSLSRIARTEGAIEALVRMRVHGTRRVVGLALEDSTTATSVPLLARQLGRFQ
jgi:hypothetical protein